MNINIGETISKIRKEKTLTQEQLSEVFGVSVAAVSKWETGTAYTDIELLPKIAEFFDMSVDRLLGYDRNTLKMTIEEHLQKADDLFYNEGKEKEAIAYLGNLTYKYPNNVKIIVKYARAKIKSVHGNPRNENHRKLFKEAEYILRSINTNGLSRHEYDLVMNELYLVYLWDKQFDNAEKIRYELNSDGPDFWFYSHKGDMEKAREKYYSVLEKSFLDDTLIYGTYHAFYDTPEKVIDLNNKYIKVIEIFAEGFSTYPYNTLSVLHESNAFMYSKLGKKGDSLTEIEKLIDIAVKKGDSYETFMESFMKTILNADERKEYALIKDSDEFKKLTEKLKSNWK